MTSLTYTYTSQPMSAKVAMDASTHKKYLKYESPVWYQHNINKFNVGDPITVVITNKKPKRTEVQNRYYFGVYLPLISDETGNEIEDLHTLFKGMFAGKEIVTVLGKPVRRVQSTTELSTGQFAEYIRQIEVFTGILAPPTQEFVLGEKIDKSKLPQYPENKLKPKF